MPSIADDVVEVITTIFLLPAVLNYLPMRIIVSQAPIAAKQGCYSTSGSFCLINRLVTTRELTPMVSGCCAIATMLPTASTPC
jgi:hypothetical protein